jgi:glycerol uptake facilitator-like aquaporin
VTVDRLAQRLVAEGIGTGLLLAAVVGSGIMADQLAGGNVGVALLANTLATAGALVALILTFGPISGAHFNPAVTVALAARRALPWGAVPGYLLAQLAGAVLGVWLAHGMFGLPVVALS